MIASLSELARLHCAASRPAMNLKGFVRHVYGTDPRYFMRIAAGKKTPSAKFLRALNNAHIRLFPSVPARVQIPNFPVTVTLGSESPQS